MNKIATFDATAVDTLYGGISLKQALHLNYGPKDMAYPIREFYIK